jgi:hypothetical protein
LDLAIVLFLLVLINILIAVGRQQNRKWLRFLLNILSFLLLIIAVLFVVRMLLG